MSCGTFLTKTKGTELGGIEGAETEFPRSNAENKKSKKRKKRRNPLGTPDNSRRLGDRARMRHISHYTKSRFVRKQYLFFCFLRSETYLF